MARLIVLAEDGTQIEIIQGEDGLHSYDCPQPCSVGYITFSLEDLIADAEIHADNAHRKEN